MCLCLSPTWRGDTLDLVVWNEQGGTGQWVSHIPGYRMLPKILKYPWRIIRLVLWNIISISKKYRYFSIWYISNQYRYRFWSFNILFRYIDIDFEVSINIEKISISILKFRYISKNIDIDFEVSIYIDIFSIYRKNIDISDKIYQFCLKKSKNVYAYFLSTFFLETKITFFLD